MMLAALALSSALAATAPQDLARPAPIAGLDSAQLSASPNIWLTHGFLPPELVAHVRSKVPTDEGAYSPCIGQVDEFDSKKCTFVPVKGDAIIEGVVAKVGQAWDVDIARLSAGGLPIIRYLPGAPPVGKHGDEDRHGVVPNATLVMYLTEATGGDASGGRTVFPEAGVTVTPLPGSVLSFQNVDERGQAHPLARHLVSAVPADAVGDRLVVQIPIAHQAGVRPFAYAEHVSGNKKPGEHESLHGTAAQKGAYQAAIAAGMSIAVAFMAAKAGKFETGDAAALEEQAKQTGKFLAEDFSAAKK